MSNSSQREKVRVFFYGSFINREVLARVDYKPDRWEVARLDGFNLALNPLATLEPSNRHCVYGVLSTATHAELGKLYGEQWVRAYQPRAVLVITLDGTFHTALCYIAGSRTRGAISELSGSHHWVPATYIERLERLRHD
jgi:Gamma-glutamyl cyclotransferase, AIG2-like